MKTKLLALSLSALLLFPLFVSCSQSSASTSASATDGYDPSHVHTPVLVPAVPATCEENGLTEGMRCDSCGIYTEIPKTVVKLGHTCENGICERCRKLIRYGSPVPETGIWNAGVYTDAFGDPTDTRVVYSDKINGTFSNSATNGSKLIVTIFAEQDAMKIKLYEYETHLVSYALYSYDVNIKHNEIKETLNVDLEDNALLFDYYDFSKLKDILCAGEDIQFVIEEDGGTSKYRFTVSASNFLYEYLIAFPDKVDVTNPANDKNIALSKFYDALSGMDTINSHSIPEMLEIYSFISDELLDITLEHLIYNHEPEDYTPEEEEKVYIQAADKFGITSEEAGMIYDFIGENHDIVLYAVNNNE